MIAFGFNKQMYISQDISVLANYVALHSIIISIYSHIALLILRFIQPQKTLSALLTIGFFALHSISGPILGLYLCCNGSQCDVHTNLPQYTPSSVLPHLSSAQLVLPQLKRIQDLCTCMSMTLHTWDLRLFWNPN